MSNDARIDDIIKLFPPNVPFSPACLKLQLLDVIFCDLLQHIEISVDRRPELYILQAIVNPVYHADSAMGTMESQLIADFKHNADRSFTTSAPTKIGESGTTLSESELIWRRVDNMKKPLFEKEKYSGIFAESPNLKEVRKSNMKYCDQNEFSTT